VLVAVLVVEALLVLMVALVVVVAIIVVPLEKVQGKLEEAQLQDRVTQVVTENTTGRH
tara:strand:+ start:38 stop:211 length:174 start_codon:yes stop_codon:yes gene_type:complete